MDSAYLDNLYLMIAGNQIDALAKEMLGKFNNDLLKAHKGEIVVLAGQFNKLSEDWTLNRMDYKEYSMEQARISQGFRIILEKIQKAMDERPTPEPAPAPPAPPAPEEQMPSAVVPPVAASRQSKELKSMGWFDHLLKVSRNVCHILSQTDGTMSTGFLLDGGWLLTNNHVLPTPEVAGNSIARFYFDEDEQGGFKPFQTVRISSADFYTHKVLNFTLTRIKEDDLAELGDLYKPEIRTALPDLNEWVTVVQHPLGGPKKVDVQARIMEILPDRVVYDAVTEPGSSGSPVFNAAFELLGIHTGKHRVPSTGEFRYKYFIPVRSMESALSDKGILPLRLE